MSSLVWLLDPLLISCTNFSMSLLRSTETSSMSDTPARTVTLCPHDSNLNLCKWIDNGVTMKRPNGYLTIHLISARSSYQGPRGACIEWDITDCHVTLYIAERHSWKLESLTTSCFLLLMKRASVNFNPFSICPKCMCLLQLLSKSYIYFFSLIKIILLLIVMRSHLIRKVWTLRESNFKLQSSSLGSILIWSKSRLISLFLLPLMYIDLNFRIIWFWLNV